MKGIQKGFTLIELMVVIAIIGILAAFAVPAYSDYTKRTYVAEGLQMAAALKSSVTVYHAARNEWPKDNKTAGITGTIAKKDVVSEIKVDGTLGVITITYGKRVGGTEALQLTLTPTAPPDNSQSTDNTIYLWTCKSKNEVMDRFIPATCEASK